MHKHVHAHGHTRTCAHPYTYGDTPPHTRTHPSHCMSSPHSQPSHSLPSARHGPADMVLFLATCSAGLSHHVGPRLGSLCSG